MTGSGNLRGAPQFFLLEDCRKNAPSTGQPATAQFRLAECRDVFAGNRRFSLAMSAFFIRTLQCP